jgi:hypothetical protein
MPEEKQTLRKSIDAPPEVPLFLHTQYRAKKVKENYEKRTIASRPAQYFCTFLPIFSP